MKQMLIQYQNSQALLKSRIAEIRTQMRNAMLTRAEADALEARRRMLVEEVYEQEQIIRSICDYLVQTGGREKGGDASCA